MKSVLFGIAAMVVISVFAWAALDAVATGSDEKYASQNNSVRLD